MRTKLTAATLSIVLVGLAIVGIVVEATFGSAVTVLQDSLLTRAVATSAQHAQELSFEVAAKAHKQIGKSLNAFRGKHPQTRGLLVLGEDNKTIRAKGDVIPPRMIKRLLRTTRADSLRDGTKFYSMVPIMSESKLVGRLLRVEHHDDADRLRRRMRVICYSTYLIVLVLLAAGVWLIGNRLTAPVIRMAGVARDVAKGNLTGQRLVVEGKDETGQLAEAINQMAAALREQVGAIKNVADKVLVTSSHIMSTTSQLNTATSEQASAIAQTTSTVEEIKQSGQATRESARQIVEGSGKSMEVSNEGLRAVEHSVAEIREVHRQVEAITDGIEELRTPIGEVGDIITSVNEIAEQSNLLAVNASIEAAKAGEYGRGFAVVAQEVKNLANRSKEATAQVRGTLGNIQTAIEQVVSTALAGRERTKSSVASIENTGQVIDRLATVISDAAGGAKHISIAANEQVVGLEQVSNAMSSVNQAASENQLGTQNLQDGSAHLNEMARELEQLVAHYRLADGQRSSDDQRRSV